MENEIFKAIPKIMTEMSAIGKDQNNRQQGWKFRGIDDVYNALQKIMGKNGVFNSVKILEMKRDEVQSKKGMKGIHAVYKYEYTFYAMDGSNVSLQSIGEGIDWGGDKVSNKCASISHKYALLQLFCVPTEDQEEPDKELHQVEPTKQPASKEQSKPINAVQKLKEATKNLHEGILPDFNTTYEDYVCQNKKFNGKTLAELDVAELLDMIAYLNGVGRQYADNLNAKEFLRNSHGYLNLKVGDSERFNYLRKKYPSNFKPKNFAPGSN